MKTLRKLFHQKFTAIHKLFIFNNLTNGSIFLLFCSFSFYSVPLRKRDFNPKLLRMAFFRISIRLVRVLMVFIVVAYSVGCKKHQPAIFEDTINQADSLLYSQPDSSLALLETLRFERESFQEDLRMRYDLLYLSARNSCDMPLQEEDIMNEVTEYYDAYGTDLEKMRAHYVLGCVYRDLHDVVRAEENLLEAYSFLDKVNEERHHYPMAVRIYGQLAELYYRQGHIEKAFKMQPRLYEYAILDGNDRAAAYSLAYLTAYYQSVNKCDSVLNISKRRKNMYMMAGDTLHAGLSLLPMLGAEMNLQLWEGMDSTLEEIENYPVLFRDTSFCRDVRKHYLYYKCVSLVNRHENDSAKRLVADYKKQASSWSEKCSADIIQVQLFNDEGQVDSAFRYLIQAYREKDSMFVENNAADMQRVESQYDYRQTRIQREKMEATHSTRKNLFITVISLIALLSMGMLVCLIVILKRQRKSRQHILSLERQGQEYQYILSKEREKGRLSEESHRKELDTIIKRIRQLETSLSHEKEQVKALEQENAGLNESLSEWRMSQWTKEKREKRKELQTLTKKMLANNTAPEKEQWDMFEDLFNGLFPQFISAIKEKVPQLTEKEMHVSMLVKLSIPHKTIAFLTGMSYSALANMRTRLVRKGEGGKGRGTQEADDWIRKLGEQ